MKRVGDWICPNPGENHVYEQEGDFPRRFACHRSSSPAHLIL